MANNEKPNLSLALQDKCCTGNTGCHFDGSLRGVKAEPIYIQKVYDAALFNLQGLRTVAGQHFRPALGKNARITKVLDIRCKKFFNPKNINDARNLTVNPTTTVSGAEFVEDGCGHEIEVVGPDGTKSEKILYTDTKDCDEELKGTPIFGTQNIEITGNVIVEIDVLYANSPDSDCDCGCDCNCGCDCECKATLFANVPIARDEAPLLLTNFFELCMPSVFDTAFLPRFTEFCNINCEVRLATNSITRDIRICPETGNVMANLIIALCVSCEKKIVVPVQLCVLSTGFPVLSPETSPICSSFPQLFPNQIDEKKHPCWPCSEKAETNCDE